jgi:hypothetical protein
MWRAVIELAEPERFVTFSRLAQTLARAREVLEIIIKRLRRMGYRFEYFCCFERHQNGWFHCHLLQKGDYIPQHVLSEALRSATHGASFVCDIRACKGRVAGYVTKYVTKQLTAEQVGRRGDGTAYKPRRVSYSRGFFDAPTSELRSELLAEWRAARGDVVESLEAPDWALVELEPLDKGRREEQHARLAACRFEEVGTAAEVSKGNLVVLRYMLGQ